MKIRGSTYSNSHLMKTITGGEEDQKITKLRGTARQVGERKSWHLETINLMGGTHSTLDMDFLDVLPALLELGGQIVN